MIWYFHHNYLVSLRKSSKSAQNCKHADGPLKLSSDWKSVKNSYEWVSTGLESNRPDNPRQTTSKARKSSAMHKNQVRRNLFTRHHNDKDYGRIHHGTFSYHAKKKKPKGITQTLAFTEDVITVVNITITSHLVDMITVSNVITAILSATNIVFAQGIPSRMMATKTEPLIWLCKLIPQLKDHIII